VVATSPSEAFWSPVVRAWPPLSWVRPSLGWPAKPLSVAGNGLLAAVGGDGDGVEDVVFLECPDGEVAVVRVVLDEHDLLVTHRVPSVLRVK